MKKALLILLGFVLVSTKAMALPGAGNFQVGDGNITNTATETNVNINTAGHTANSNPVSVINWSGFNIAAGEAVNFNNNTGASLTTINIDNAGTISNINGAINVAGAANNIVLINPVGVSIGDSAHISTGAGAFLAVSGTATVDAADPEAVTIDVALNDAPIAISESAQFEGIAGGNDVAIIDMNMEAHAPITESVYLPFVYNNKNSANENLTINVDTPLKTDGIAIINGVMKVQNANQLTMNNYTTSNQDTGSSIDLGSAGTVNFNQTHNALLDANHQVNAHNYNFDNSITDSILTFFDEIGSSLNLLNTELKNSSLTLVGESVTTAGSNVLIDSNSSLNAVDTENTFGATLFNVTGTNNGQITIDSKQSIVASFDLNGSGNLSMKTSGDGHIVSLLDSSVAQNQIDVNAEAATANISNSALQTNQFTVKAKTIYATDSAIQSQTTSLTATSADAAASVVALNNTTVTASTLDVAANQIQMINHTEVNADNINFTITPSNLGYGETYLQDSSTLIAEIISISGGSQYYTDATVKGANTQLSGADLSFTNTLIENSLNDGQIDFAYSGMTADANSDLSAKTVYFPSAWSYSDMTVNADIATTPATAGAGVTKISSTGFTTITNSHFKNGEPAPVVETPTEPETPVVETPTEPETPVVETPTEPETPVVETPTEPETPVVETPTEPETPVIETPIDEIFVSQVGVNPMNVKLDSDIKENQMQGNTLVFAANDNTESATISVTMDGE